MTHQGASSSTSYSDAYTKPVSLITPSSKDQELTRDLLTYLQSENLFESEKESQKREIVLGKLNMLVKEWIRDVSLCKVRFFYLNL